MRIRILSYFLFFFSLLSSEGCKQLNVFESTIPIANHDWYNSKIINGSFQITDTNSLYRNFIVIRHTDAYNYNNIWLELGLQEPGEAMIYRKLDLALGNDERGWLGSGMDDIWEVRIPLSSTPRKFIKSGTYHYSIRQLMREDPLKEVMSVGFRVEKSAP